MHFSLPETFPLAMARAGTLPDTPYGDDRLGTRYIGGVSIV